MEPEKQVQRLKLFIDRLGEFPDRDVVHQLTETARLGLSSGKVALATRMSDEVLAILTDSSTAPGRRVPLFYALDSIVKNVGGEYQPLMSTRIVEAFDQSFAVVTEKDRARLHHVLKTWNEKAIFIEHLDQLNAIVAPWHIALMQAHQPKQPAPVRSVKPLPVAPPVARQAVPVAPPRQIPVAPPVIAPLARPMRPRRQAAAARRRGLDIALPQISSSSQPPQQPQPPPNKRPRMMDVVIKDEDPVVAEARDILARMQFELNEANPMTLEELRDAEPSLYEQVLAEAKAKRPSAHSNNKGEWPEALPPGPSFGADAQLFLDHGAKLAANLDYRASCARRGAAPSSVSPALAKCAVDVAAHLKQLMQRREPARRQRLARDAVDTITQAVDDSDEPVVDPPRKIPRRVPAMAAVADLDIPPETLLSSTVDARAVDSLYSRFAVQCKEDGLRFASQDELQEHMDLVFRKNRERADRSRGVVSRVWGPKASTWAAVERLVPSIVKAPDVVDDVDEPSSAVADDEPKVAVPDTPTNCRVCGEPFQVQWDDASQDWILADAVRASLPDGTPLLVHKHCRDAAAGPDKVIRPDQLIDNVPGPLMVDEDQPPDEAPVVSSSESPHHNDDDAPVVAPMIVVKEDVAVPPSKPDLPAAAASS